MKKFRITYNDGPMGNKMAQKAIVANDMDEARHIAYSLPEAKNRDFTDFTLEEIVDGPKVIGICYEYIDLQSRKTYQNYTFIRANDEAQAKEYYNMNVRGKRFYQPWPNKFDENGNCEAGKVAYTYFAGGSGYTYDALSKRKTENENKDATA